jgi:hypothetical protein
MYLETSLAILVGPLEISKQKYYQMPHLLFHIDLRTTYL